MSQGLAGRFPRTCANQIEQTLLERLLQTCVSKSAPATGGCNAVALQNLWQPPASCVLPRHKRLTARRNEGATALPHFAVIAHLNFSCTSSHMGLPLMRQTGAASGATTPYVPVGVIGVAQVLLKQYILALIPRGGTRLFI